MFSKNGTQVAPAGDVEMGWFRESLHIPKRVNPKEEENMKENDMKEEQGDAETVRAAKISPDPVVTVSRVNPSNLSPSDVRVARPSFAVGARALASKWLPAGMIISENLADRTCKVELLGESIGTLRCNRDKVSGLTPIKGEVVHSLNYVVSIAKKRHVYLATINAPPTQPQHNTTHRVITFIPCLNILSTLLIPSPAMSPPPT